MPSVTFSNAASAAAVATTGGDLNTGTHAMFIVNKTKSAIVVDDVTSSSSELTHDGEFPRKMQSGESYRFLATATGDGHTLSIAAGGITSVHTQIAVDTNNAEGAQFPQRVYFGTL